jgi:hypothetical protein
MKKLLQNLLFLFKKVFQSFLLLLGTFFLILSVSMAWNIFFDDGMSIPTDEELVVECNAMIYEGAYKNFAKAEQLGACLDDSYKALAASPFMIILLPLWLFLAWILLRFGLRVFRRQ